MRRLFWCRSLTPLAPFFKEIKPPEKPPWSQKKPLVILEMCKNKKNETNPCTFKNEYRALRDRYRDHIPIFTDGSKEGNKVGYAVHTEYGDLTGALHGRASIFTAEHPVGVPGRGFLLLRKNRLPVSPACRKRRLKGSPVGVRGQRIGPQYPLLIVKGDKKGKLS